MSSFFENLEISKKSILSKARVCRKLELSKSSRSSNTRACQTRLIERSRVVSNVGRMTEIPGDASVPRPALTRCELPTPNSKVRR